MSVLRSKYKPVLFICCEMTVLLTFTQEIQFKPGRSDVPSAFILIVSADSLTRYTASCIPGRKPEYILERFETDCIAAWYKNSENIVFKNIWECICLKQSYHVPIYLMIFNNNLYPLN